LDELGFVGRGKSRHRPRNDVRLYGGPYPFIQTAEIMAADPYITAYSQTYSEFGLQQSKMWPPNTLCLTIAGANTAKNAILRFQACFPDSVVGFIPDNDKSDLHFIKYSLDLMRHRFLSVSRGATQDNLSLDKLLSFPLLVPEVQEQRRIAGILSAYDDLIENSQRRIKILEEMARRLYREWFVHFRFPGHEDCRLVDSPLGEIPEGWCISSIGEICSRVTDGSHHSPKSVAEGLPMASSKDMHDWGLNLDTARHISPIDFDKLARNDCQPLKNDVLITKDGANYLKHVFVTRVDQEVVLLSSVALLRPSSLIIPHLLAATLKDPATKGRLSNYVTGAAIPRIILSDFKQFQILLPPKAIQGSWGRIAESLTMNIWLLLDQIKNLRRTRDLLLPRLLSGLIDIESLPEPVLSEP
jgi:type I restriction enzyme S subunit